MAERPAAAFANNSAALLPSGEITPIPVTATRLMPVDAAEQVPGRPRLSVFPYPVALPTLGDAVSYIDGLDIKLVFDKK